MPNCWQFMTPSTINNQQEPTFGPGSSASQILLLIAFSIIPPNLLLAILIRTGNPHLQLALLSDVIFLHRAACPLTLIKAQWSVQRPARLLEAWVRSREEARRENRIKYRNERNTGKAQHDVVNGGRWQVS